MNAIVIVANGLHLGYLGCYGNAWIRTPSLDTLASQSVVFDQCFVESPQPLAVHRSWWTGRYATPSMPEFNRILESAPPLNRLSEVGVRTGFISDHWLLSGSSSQIDRSFDEVTWIRGQGYDRYVSQQQVEIAPAEWSRWWQPAEDAPRYAEWRLRFEQFLRNRSRITGEETTPLAQVVDAGTDWIRDQTTGRPFLLWMECSDPHAPWGPPEGYLELYRGADDESRPMPPVAADPLAGVVGESISEAELEAFRQAYSAEVTFVDAWLGEFLERLDRRGVLADSLVMVLSGQGVALGEHDTVGNAPPRVLEEMAHVPLILRLPGARRGGTRSQALVQSPDVAATLLEVFGQTTALQPRSVHGGSLLDIAQGEATKLRDYAVSWVRGKSAGGEEWEEWSLRTHGWHLVLPVRPPAETPSRSRHLYAKPEDRWDHNDVSDQFPEGSDQLELVLRRFESAVAEDALEDLPPLRESSLIQGR